MPGPLEGVRVVEVANWTFVPAAGAVLSDLGADVIKGEVHQALDGFTGVWAPVLRPSEVPDHPQVEPNVFFPLVTPQNGNPVHLVPAPMRFDDQPTVPQGAAPELGQHTEEILLETGLDWDEIS